MLYYKVSRLIVPESFAIQEPDNLDTAFRINKHNVIAGYCYDTRQVLYPEQATIWRKNHPQLLYPPTQSAARDINNDNAIVGYFGPQGESGTGASTPFIFDGTSFNISVLKGFDGNNAIGYATGINDNGEICGYLTQPGGYPLPSSCVKWRNKDVIPTDLGNLGFPLCGSTDINNNGFVIGWSRKKEVGDNYAFIWNPNTGKMEDIGLTSGLSGVAHGINELQFPQVVGISAGQAFFYNAATSSMYQIGVNGESSIANDINSGGEIVGNAGGKAVLWIWDGLLRADLNNALISDAAINGWVLTSAHSINDKGYIVGLGILNGSKEPFILSPPPQKELYGALIRQVSIDSVLPHFFWPGDPARSAKPQNWPQDLYFPLLSPGPFEFTGPARIEVQKLVKGGLRETSEKLRAIMS